MLRGGVEVDAAPSWRRRPVGVQHGVEVAHAHVVRDDRELVACRSAARRCFEVAHGPAQRRARVEALVGARGGRAAVAAWARAGRCGASGARCAATSTRIPSRLVAGLGEDLRQPDGPLRSSLARAAGLPALSRKTIASSRSGSTSPACALDQRPPAVDAAGGRHSPARALRVQHLAVPGGGAPRELGVAVGAVPERVGLARVDGDRAEGRRAVLAREGDAGERGGRDEREDHQRTGGCGGAPARSLGGSGA